MVQVTAFCQILAEFVIYTEVAVSETSAACCFLPAIRSSAYAMVGLLLECSELSVVFVERASKINSARLNPETRYRLPMSAIFPVPQTTISKQYPICRERLHSRV